tara:strand:+ start:260 stop:1672 length:1413 start_codon:yes stop_codon:yes gene_type:complete
MQRKPLSFAKTSSEIDNFAEIIKSGKYFLNVSKSHIKEILHHSELVILNKDENLISKDQTNPPELIILLEGSLALKSKGKLIKRLNNSGDLVGELSVISGEYTPFDDIISEEQSKFVILPYHKFKATDGDTKVSVAYLIFSNILAEKLKHLKAQAILNKNVRSENNSAAQIGILDTDKKSLEMIIHALKVIWSKAKVIQIETFQEFLEKPFEYVFDLLIVDPEDISGFKSKNYSIDRINKIYNLFPAPIMVISRFCEKEDNRIFLSELGVTDFLIKPFAKFDLQHALTKFRNDHYRQKELEEVLIEADTDKLTGLANRRKLDEFLEALVTIFQEGKQSFSLIMADVDHFKYYNDAHGHQMGDLVLKSLSSILKNSIRKGDLAARFGGEEFVIILPNCSKKNAVLIGNKLRDAINDLKIKYQEQQPMGKLTCTFGIATYPDDANTKEHLLKRADERLYDGKASGRNKVVAA